MLLDSTKVTLAEAAAADQEIIDLITGEVVPLDDADALINSYERTKTKADQLYSLEKRIRLAIGQLTEGDAKTRRVRGKKRSAKVEMPDDYWVQSILKEAWNSYPSLRDEFLRIESIGVKAREWKKLKETAGPADVEQFKKMLATANAGPAGTPRVTVEK